MSADAIARDIQQGKYAPMYFFHGEEPFFIDRLANYLESKVLTEDEKAFNQTILYGKETDVQQIIEAAKRFPMMAQHQVVIVKEAQELSRSIDQLAAYVSNMQASTVLIVCYKYKKLDGRSKLSKLLAKSDAVVFESKKIWANKLPQWVKEQMARYQMTATPKAIQMMSENIGENLIEMSKAIENLRLNVPKGQQITPTLVEEYTGISKDYNIFELLDAVGNRDVLRAQKIAHQFSLDPREHPIPAIVPMMNNFFVQVLEFHALRLKTANAIKDSTRMNYFQAQRYATAVGNYSMRMATRNMGYLRKADAQSKGVNVHALDYYDLLKELLANLMS